MINSYCQRLVGVISAEGVTPVTEGTGSHIFSTQNIPHIFYSNYKNVFFFCLISFIEVLLSHFTTYSIKSDYVLGQICTEIQKTLTYRQTKPK